ncbi:hypothetical protein [Sphingomonas sp. Root710]|nr:hypothetical protein [Sphingomonas sp. Root710]
MLNVFQHPPAGKSDAGRSSGEFAHLSCFARSAEWMLKHVQHDG